MSESNAEQATNGGEKQETPKKQEQPKPSKKKKPTTKTVDLHVEHFVSSLSQIDLNKVIEREVPINLPYIFVVCSVLPIRCYVQL